jgi:3-oxoacyl-[acyl-carrier-protein] synthase III
MRTADMFIKGVGVYVPPTVSVEWAVEQGLYPEETAKAQGLLSAAVAGDVPAPEMALRAAQEAVKRCGQSPTDLDLLLCPATWYQGPEGWLPHSYLQDKLTGGDVLAMEIRQGCGGMIGGMELAASYLRAEPERRTAMLVASDNYGTPLMDRWNAGGYILGDAASALIMSKEPGFAQLLSVASATVPGFDVDMEYTAEPLFPPGILVGRGANYKIRQQNLFASKGGKKAAAARMLKVHQKTAELVERVLSEAGITTADVKRVAIQNVAREIVDKRGMLVMGIDYEKSTWEYGRTIGHCGASDQILSFDQLLVTRELVAGDYLLIYGSGPGITISFAVVKILENPPWVG